MDFDPGQELIPRTVRGVALAEHPFRGLHRDAKILTIGEGTGEMRQLAIARALGA